MMKNTLVFFKERDISSCFMLLLTGFLIAGSHQLITLIFVLLMSCYSYHKGMIQYLVYVISICLGSIVFRNTSGIIYLTFVAFDFICMKGYSLVKLDATNLMKYWNTAILLLTSYLLYENVNTSIILGAGCFVLHHFFDQYESEGKYLKSAVYFVLSASIYILLSQYQVGYQEYYTIFFLCLSAYFLPFEICCLLFLYFLFLDIDAVYLLFLLFINYHKEKRYLYSFFAMFLLLYNSGMYTLIFVSSCLFLGLFNYRENNAFMQETQLIEKNHQLYMEHSFYRQLMNYSSVFYDLSKYYSDINEMEAQMLELMGDALEYNAKVSRHYCHQKEEMNKRISEMLKGYKFQLLACESYEDENKIQIHLDLMYLYDKELEEVIIPLLEKVSNTRLRVVKKNTYPLQKDRIKIILESLEYLQINTYGKSLHVREISGDSYQTFHMQDNVVCMLSDGMGQGNRAQKTSSLLIQIMEAMMRCQIPQVECIKMINYFMRSDVFATLDVLSFDRKANMAYLSKSASAPTYLYRENELYEMNAHSLPIGIVDNIKADVYEIAFKKNDIFIMASDGVSKSEIEKWVNLKRCTNVKNEGINMMNILSDKKRNDDSTILMAKVS